LLKGKVQNLKNGFTQFTKNRNKDMMKINPIKLGIIWKRLNGMIDEVAESFIRSSFSAVVRENYDMAFSLLDVKGRQFIQTKKSIPSFIGTLPHTLQEILKKIPADDFSEGDVVISNDSWLGTGHLNDITMVAPIFKDSKLIAFAGSTAHTVDIGGAPSPNAQDSFEEGLCIPVCKIVEKGVENKIVIDFLEQNLREPEETLGDIRAQFSAYAVATKKLLVLLEEENLNDLDLIISNILQKSEESMRKKISEIPDGKYYDEMLVDGFENPLSIKCMIEIKKDKIKVDFTGTSQQINRPINSVFNYTYAYACYALKCAIDPNAPNNDGSFRTITIKAPEGTIVNPRRPAPVWGRHLTGHYIPPAIYGALSKVIPNKVIAESGSPLWNIYFKGRQELNDKPFVKMFFMNGGHGARSKSDGPGCLSFPSNVSNQSIEQFENQAPLLIHEKSFVKDTQGIGQYVGGPAQKISFESTSHKTIMMTIRHERVLYPPRGIMGGGNGSKGIDLVNNKRIPAKTSYPLKFGDIASFQTPGGGGMFPAKKRNVKKVLNDIDSQLLSSKKAKLFYQKQLERNNND